MGSLSLTATLVPRGPADAVVRADEQVAVVAAGAKRFPVTATINGYAWRTTITRMRGEDLVGLNRAVREETREQRVSQALKILREGRTVS